MNEALNEQQFCTTCIALAALKGAAIGAVSAVPFLFLLATAGVAAFAGVGGLSGAVGYLGSVAAGAKFSWAALAVSVGLGAVTAGLLRFAAPKIGEFFAGEPEGAAAPRSEAPPESGEGGPPPEGDAESEDVDATGDEAEDQPPEKQVMVYRGTDRTAENATYDETGHLLSDAAQQNYQQTGDLDSAYSSSQATHDQWVEERGSEGDYGGDLGGT